MEQNEQSTTSDILIKCRFCGRRFLGDGGEMREDGIIIGECRHCAFVLKDRKFGCKLGMNHCVSGTSDCEYQSVVDGYCKHYKPKYLTI